MIYIHGSDSTIDKQVSAVCAPLFASNQFLKGGHSEATINATVTFIQFQGRVYAVTCHHVLSTFQTDALKSGRRVVPSIHSGRSIHQFHIYGPNGEYRWSFLSCRDFPSDANINNPTLLEKLEVENSGRPDIAIAEITDVWLALKSMRGAEAINLDDWVEPDWSIARPIWMAYGFPDGHKYRSDDKVSAPMPRVSVELSSSPPDTNKRHYTLCSTLENEHGWGFSGLSGGPVLIAHATPSDNRYAYVGITYEGAPGAADIQANPDSFVGKNDIILQGYHLTPVQFQDWLGQLSYDVQFSQLPPLRTRRMPVQ